MPVARSLIVTRRDTLPAVVFGSLALTEVLLLSPALHGSARSNAVCVAIMAAALAWLRVAPLAAAVVALAAATVLTAALTPATDLLSYVVLVALVACGTAVWARSAASAAVGLGLCLTQSSVAVALARDPWDDALFWSPFALACWLLGSVLRVRAQATADSARERMAQAQRERLAAEAERARVARELHDVVAHAVTLATIQAQVAREALPPGADDSRAALQALERACRAALDDLRRMLGVLRDVDASRDPQPGLGDLEALAEMARATGPTVALRIAPAALTGIPAGVALTVHRIVQEGVTNALRHAPGAAIEIAVDRHGHELVVEVRNGPGSGSGSGNGRVAAAAGTGTGTGLAGMRERVRLWDGGMEAGPSADGGWTLVARIPAGDAVAA